MKTRSSLSLCAALGLAAAAAAGTADAAPPLRSALVWSTVVNNGDVMPESTKNFNSYNQPSVNGAGLVVFRARGKGPGEPPHGIYTRAMGQARSAIAKVVDRSSTVPDPNNLSTTYIEFPSFPRIDIDSGTFAFRGNSAPVWQYTLADGTDTRAGTTGIFTNPADRLVTGASKLGAVSEFAFYSVPGVSPPTAFDVFPGAPSPTDEATIVFKGNYTIEIDGIPVGKTGVFFRDLEPAIAGGAEPVRLIANTLATHIPGTYPPVLFGSTSPPSAVGRVAVFAGFDNEENPGAGGIYAVRLPRCAHPGLSDRKACAAAAGEPLPLRTLVSIGAPVPDSKGKPTSGRFNRLGEGVSFDGRFVAFWGAWGTATKAVSVQCPEEGNKPRRDFCLLQSPLKDLSLEPAVPGNHTGLFVFQVPVQQGFFVADARSGQIRMAARTNAEFDDFLFWNFSGKVQGVGTDGDDDAEPARWRASSFVAVDTGDDAAYRAAFKARKTDGATGIYLTAGPGRAASDVVTVIESAMDGGLLDPRAAGLPVSEMGLEREGLRNGWLTINASMGDEEAGWAGIYLTRLK